MNLTLTKIKKVTIPMIFLGIILVMILFFLIDITSKTPSSPQLNISLLKNPISNSGTETQAKISLSPDIQVPNIPNMLDVYIIEDDLISQQQPDALGPTFGFTTPPSQLSDINEGTLYYWESESQSLRFIPQTHSLQFKVYTPPPSDAGSFPTEEELSQKALSYLAKYPIINTSDLKLEGITYLISHGDEQSQVASAKNSNLAVIKFSQTIDGYPIISSIPTLGSISVTLTNHQDLGSIRISYFSSLKSSGSAPTRNLNSIKSSLSQAKIFQIDSGKMKTDETVSFETLENIIIRQITIAYLIEPNLQTHLQPIYVLFGDAQIVNVGVVPITLYLPAIAH